MHMLLHSTDSCTFVWSQMRQERANRQTCEFTARRKIMLLFLGRDAVVGSDRGEDPLDLLGREGKGVIIGYRKGGRSCGG